LCEPIRHITSSQRKSGIFFQLLHRHLVIFHFAPFYLSAFVPDHEVDICLPPRNCNWESDHRWMIQKGKQNIHNKDSLKSKDNMFWGQAWEIFMLHLRKRFDLEGAALLINFRYRLNVSTSGGRHLNKVHFCQYWRYRKSRTMKILYKPEQQ